MKSSLSSPRSPAGRIACGVFAWIFGGVFLFAGVLKVRDPQLFTMQVRAFELLPDPLNAFLALGLPWLEIFCGLAVISGWLRTGGLLLLDAALLVFIGVLGSALARGKQIDCGCFGGAAHLSQVQELSLDVALLIVGIVLLVGAVRSARLSLQKQELA
jgi:uncharacterized membrane protein YphA (DoxX/SURF4 family)